METCRVRWLLFGWFSLSTVAAGFGLPLVGSCSSNGSGRWKLIWGDAAFFAGFVVLLPICDRMGFSDGGGDGFYCVRRTGEDAGVPDLRWQDEISLKSGIAAAGDLLGWRSRTGADRI
ncbi:hypothetical protein ACLOJK_015540 [Asimina triloba]